MVINTTLVAWEQLNSGQFLTICFIAYARNGKLFECFWQRQVDRNEYPFCNSILIMILCRSGSINIVEFTDLCGALFRNSSGKPYWWESDSRIWVLLIYYSLAALTVPPSLNYFPSSMFLVTGVWALRSSDFVTMSGSRRSVSHSHTNSMLTLSYFSSFHGFYSPMERGCSITQKYWPCCR